MLHYINNSLKFKCCSYRIFQVSNQKILWLSYTVHNDNQTSSSGDIQDFYNLVSISINILMLESPLITYWQYACYCLNGLRSESNWKILLRVSYMDRYEKKQLHSVWSTLSSCKAWAYLGDLGAYSPRKFWKNNTLRLNLKTILIKICKCELTASLTLCS